MLQARFPLGPARRLHVLMAAEQKADLQSYWVGHFKTVNRWTPLQLSNTDPRLIDSQTTFTCVKYAITLSKWTWYQKLVKDRSNTNISWILLFFFPSNLQQPGALDKLCYHDSAQPMGKCNARKLIILFLWMCRLHGCHLALSWLYQKCI